MKKFVPTGVLTSQGITSEVILTKREKFAMAAMQGILASKYYGEFGDKGNKTGNDVVVGAVAIAVNHADALLAELEK